MDEVTTKVCCKCNVAHPVENYFLYKETGLRAQICKACRYAQIKASKDRRKKLNAGYESVGNCWKTCSKCDAYKNKTEFYRDASSFDILSSQCKECMREAKRNYCQKKKGEKLSQ